MCAALRLMNIFHRHPSPSMMTDGFSFGQQQHLPDPYHVGREVVQRHDFFVPRSGSEMGARDVLERVSGLDVVDGIPSSLWRWRLRLWRRHRWGHSAVQHGFDRRAESVHAFAVIGQPLARIRMVVGDAFSVPFKVPEYVCDGDIILLA